MEQGQHGGPVGVVASAKALVANAGQPMGNEGCFQAVLTDILLAGIAHQAPPVDVFHPGKHGEKMIQKIISHPKNHK